MTACHVASINCPWASRLWKDTAEPAWSNTYPPDTKGGMWPPCHRAADGEAACAHTPDAVLSRPCLNPPPHRSACCVTGLMNAWKVKSSLLRMVKTREISQSGFSLDLSMNVVFDNQLALWQMPLELNESDIIICMFLWVGLQPAHFTDEGGSVQRGYLSQNLWIQWAACYKMGIFLLPAFP